MVMLVVAVAVAQPAIVYVTVYVPGVLVFGVTVPVDALMVKPAGDAVYVPPVVPVRVTGALVRLEQYGLPA